MSRYYSPYATKHKPRRWPAILAVVLALVVGVGVGMAASGGDGLVSRAVTANRNRDAGRRSPPTDQTSTPHEQDPAPTATDEPASPRQHRRAGSDEHDRAERSRSDRDPETDREPARLRSTPTPDAGPPEETARRFVATWSGGDYTALYADAQHRLEGDDQRAGFRRPLRRDQHRGRHHRNQGRNRPAVRISISTCRSRSATRPAPSAISRRTNTIHLVREGAEWHVDWTPSLIFTQLGDGCVDFMVENVRRGSILDRNGDPLAYDGSASVIGVIPGRVPG